MDDQDNQYNVEDLYRANDCQEALHTLYHYLDGELTEDRRVAIEHHLHECEPCLHAFDFEAELKIVIARSCRDQVPDHLRSKIAQALSEASKGKQGSV
ncbi:MAG TPA: mycothiol system anti-sigma-R factor [Acidimicrobiales bacterium]|jgi:mycothiol system anti-sigma-R factor|nr:mycothiol system anti-sigma-R factor [Acidimicrobiales bacterium]